MDFQIALLAIGAMTLVLLFIEVNFTYLTQGFAYGFSADRPKVEFSPLAQRIKKTYQNQLDNAAYTTPILAAAAFMGIEHSGAEMAAWLIVIGRALYCVFYISGIPYARLPGFGLAVFPTAYLALVLFQHM